MGIPAPKAGSCMELLRHGLTAKAAVPSGKTCASIKYVRG
jgi:hypothetical protein